VDGLISESPPQQVIDVRNPRLAVCRSLGASLVALLLTANSPAWAESDKSKPTQSKRVQLACASETCEQTHAIHVDGRYAESKGECTFLTPPSQVSFPTNARNYSFHCDLHSQVCAEVTAAQSADVSSLSAGIQAQTIHVTETSVTIRIKQREGRGSFETSVNVRPSYGEL